MTVTLSIPVIVMLSISAALFICVVLMNRDSSSGGNFPDIGRFFALVTYLIFWLLPSLLMWSVWATWFRT